VRGYWTGLLLAGVVVGLATEPAQAQSFSLTQITNSGRSESNNPSINAAGTRIAFVSTGDLTPGGPGNADGNAEIFLFDTITGLFTQITNSTSSFGYGRPSINASGDRIAFVSEPFPSTDRQIFLFDTTAGTLTQITNTFSCSNDTPRIDAAGTRIAFVSTCDLTPGSPGNADRNQEIFLFDTATARFTQITNTVAGVTSAPSIDAAGTRIVFISDRDLMPGNPGNADGNDEIFLFDTATGRFTQITNTTGFCCAHESPSINAAGTRIAFASRRDLTPAMPGNADGNLEIFLFDMATGLLTQITNSAGGSNSSPSIDAAGTRIVFVSSRDLTPGSPGNADNNFEIFVFDITTGRFTQLTNTTIFPGNFGFLGSLNPSISAAGTRIAFGSVHDLTPGDPGNTDGFVEIFLATISAPAVGSIPTLSQWFQLVLIALLVVGGPYGLRRRAGRNSRPLA
jgi:Tol biopolymer transport system component